MSNATTVYVLGAPDPEMSEIETILRACGCSIVHSCRGDGRRVTPREAYSDECSARIPDGTTHVVLVECDPQLLDYQSDDSFAGPLSRTIVDHHRPGDPGYGAPPADAVRASSQGQIIELLAERGLLPESWQRAKDLAGTTAGRIYQPRIGVQHYTVVGWRASFGDDQSPLPFPETLIIPERYVIAAAADHCLGHAYAGKVPAVARDAVLDWRAQCAGARSGMSADDWAAQVRATADALDDAPITACGLRDLRRTGHMPELPDAACYAGEAYLTQVDCPDGRRKLVVGGAASPAQVAGARAIMRSEGCTDLYGDPARGFAGGYLP